MAQAQFYCPQCKQNRLFAANDINHVAHILASVFLCGLWLPVWFAETATHKQYWRCQTCGFGGTAKQLNEIYEQLSWRPPPAPKPPRKIKIHRNIDKEP